MRRTNGPENEVAVLITDIHQYSRLTSNMTAEGIRDYMIGYHGHLQTMVMDNQERADEFEPCAGDASIAIFRQKAGEGREQKCRRALKVALTVAEAIESGKIPFTRIGIYVGDIIEAPFGALTLRFGNCFAAANRPEELCAYFGTTILMDREVALAQDDLAQYIVAIGKVTPKSFEHPIHVYSIYKPGIHKCPADVDWERLRAFIALKNEAIEYFIGNAQKGITPNFQIAEQKLHQAEMAFTVATGQLDVATLRISQYIHENPYPVDTFEQQGMAIDEKQGHSIGIRLLLLSQQLIKAFDREFYHALIENTDWESLFRIHWFKEGDVIMSIGDEPNGIYYLARGDVRVQDAGGKTIAQLSDGDIFGEMAYFTDDRRRSATVVAMTDIAVRRISTEDFERTPVLHSLFAEIARRRTRPV